VESLLKGPCPKSGESKRKLKAEDRSFLPQQSFLGGPFQGQVVVPSEAWGQQHGRFQKLAASHFAFSTPVLDVETKVPFPGSPLLNRSLRLALNTPWENYFAW